MDKYLQANRALGDEWSGINYRSDFYKVEAFKAGRHCPRDKRPSRRIPPRVHVLRVAGLLAAAGRRWPLSPATRARRRAAPLLFTESQQAASGGLTPRNLRSPPLQ